MSVRSDFTEEDGWFTGEDKGCVFIIRNLTPPTRTNITGWTIEWKLSDTLAGEPILMLSAAITDAANGVCQVNVPSADTIDLDPGTYYYDLRRTNLGSYSLLAYGTVALLDPYVDEDPWKVL